MIVLTKKIENGKKITYYDSSKSSTFKRWPNNNNILSVNFESGKMTARFVSDDLRVGSLHLKDA